MSDLKEAILSLKKCVGFLHGSGNAVLIGTMTIKIIDSIDYLEDGDKDKAADNMWEAIYVAYKMIYEALAEKMKLDRIDASLHTKSNNYKSAAKMYYDGCVRSTKDTGLEYLFKDLL